MCSLGNFMLRLWMFSQFHHTLIVHSANLTELLTDFVCIASRACEINHQFAVSD